MSAIDTLMGRNNQKTVDERFIKTRILPTGGRVSVDVSSKIPFSLLVTDKADGNRIQKYVDLDLKDIGKRKIEDLYKILIDSDPDVSLALFHFLAFTGVGYRLQVLYPDSDKEHKRGKQILDDFMDTLESYYGGFDVLLDQMFFSFFLAGASFMELLLDSSGRDVVDLIVISPYEARFRKFNYPERGDRWQLGQIINDEFERLDIYDTVAYIPFHPAVGSPYGRAFLSPTVFSSLFLISMLKDLERVIRHQGWKRLDLILDMEKLKLPATEDLPDGVTHQSLVDDALASIRSQCSTLEPDDVFVHTDQFEFGEAVGVTDRFSFTGIADVIRILERRIIRALKSQPLLMGNNDGTSETHANRQWEIYTASIQSVQKRLGSSLSRLFKVALQARGIIADVSMIFDEFRDLERQNDLMADKIELDNIQFQVDNDYISKEEAQGILRRKLRRYLL